MWQPEWVFILYKWYRELTCLEELVSEVAWQHLHTTWVLHVNVKPYDVTWQGTTLCVTDCLYGAHTMVAG